MDRTFKGAAKRLDDIDLPKLGYMMKVGEDELHAFLDVETTGSGFDSKGRPKMLFEPHKFYANLAGAKRTAAVKAGVAYKNYGEKPYPSDSYPRLKIAMAIDEEAAMESCSWQIGQVLGEYYAICGYATVQDFVQAMMDDEEAGLLASVRFILKKGLDKALRAHDWAKFAAGYNGSAYRKNHYDTKLASAFTKWQRIKDTPWTPPTGAAPHLITSVRPDPASATVSAETGTVVYSDQENVSFVQKKLLSLGYTEVGGTEGAKGPFTDAAIRAYRADNNLPQSTDIDDALIESFKTAKKREIAVARSEATATDVTTKVPEARHNWLSKVTAGGLGGTAGAGVLVDGVLKNVTDAKSYVSEFTDYLANIPGWAWCLAILAVAGFIYWKSQQSENASVEAFQTGARR